MEEPTRVEQFNQIVRSLVTVTLCAGFVWGFFVGRIGGDIFTAIFASVIGYWFASRDQKTRVVDDMRAQIAALPTTTTKTADATTTTAPTAAAVDRKDD